MTQAHSLLAPSCTTRSETSTSLTNVLSGKMISFKWINKHVIENFIQIFCRLMSRSVDVLGDDSLPNELLFGRTGFLWALLFVQKHLGADVVEATTIPKVRRSVPFLSFAVNLSHCRDMNSW